MTPRNEKRSARDVGSDSPAKGSAKRQSIAGSKGGPREAQERGMSAQPPQTSNRRSAKHEHAPTESKSLDPQHDPDQQGRGEARAGTVKRGSGMQGLAGGRGDRSTRM